MVAALISGTGCLLQEEDDDGADGVGEKLTYGYLNYALATVGVSVTASYAPELKLGVSFPPDPKDPSHPRTRICPGLLPLTFSIDGVAGGGQVRQPSWSDVRDPDGNVTKSCTPTGIVLDIPSSVLGQGKQLQISDGTTTLSFPIDGPQP